MQAVRYQCTHTKPNVTHPSRFCSLFYDCFDSDKDCHRWQPVARPTGTCSSMSHPQAGLSWHKQKRGPSILYGFHFRAWSLLLSRPLPYPCQSFQIASFPNLFRQLGLGTSASLSLWYCFLFFFVVIILSFKSCNGNVGFLHTYYWIGSVTNIFYQGGASSQQIRTPNQHKSMLSPLSFLLVF